MGVVWQGHDERLNRPVAIKKLLLRPGLPPAKAAEAVARCLREGRIAARLNHPNAISVFDVVDEDDVPCLVMEYMPSRSLAMVMAEEQALAPDKVAGVGAQAAAGLAAAHAAGIVHRDMAPGNVLLGEDGAVKITDFGISRAADDVSVTRTGMFAGTPAYLAPEVALGDAPTPASDVFSLGSTLYAAVEGQPPFGVAANTLGVLHAVAGGKINPPQRSGPLTDALVALLEVDPRSRPTATEARDLLAAVGEVPVHLMPTALPSLPATEPAPSPQAPITVRTAPPGRARGAMAAAGVFVVALIAVGLWLLGSRDNLIPAKEQTPSNEPGHSDTVPAPGPAPASGAVAPANAGEPTGNAKAPAPGTDQPNTAPTSAAETPPPTTGTTAPPVTTTENAAEPTEDTTPPPTTDTGEPETAPPSTISG
jgi:serine/threonine protein kinase